MRRKERSEEPAPRDARQLELDGLLRRGEAGIGDVFRVYEQIEKVYFASTGQLGVAEFISKDSTTTLMR